jgi:hypothetical protein
LREKLQAELKANQGEVDPGSGRVDV